MSTEPCELHEIIGCTVCSGRDARERRAAATPSRPIAARYDGRCGECDGDIRAGQIIVMRDGKAVHAACRQ